MTDDRGFFSEFAFRSLWSITGEDHIKGSGG